jgi:hypothetical protein
MLGWTPEFEKRDFTGGNGGSRDLKSFLRQDEQDEQHGKNPVNPGILSGNSESPLFPSLPSVSNQRQSA